MKDRASPNCIATMILLFVALAPGGTSSASEPRPQVGIAVPLALSARTGVWEAAPASTEHSSPRADTSRYWLPDSLETGWFASDKKLHLLACYSIVLTGKIAADRVETGVIGAAALSLGKELWDLWFKTPRSRSGMSKGDFAADAFGIGVGILVVEALGQ